MYQEEEFFFICPYCGQEISMLLDISLRGRQTYIEDCEVCCNPVQISYRVEDESVVNFRTERAD